MTRQAQEQALKIFLVTLIIFLAGLGITFWLFIRYPDQPAGTGEATAPVTVTIPKGSSLKQVVTLLASRGVVESPKLFYFYASQRGIAGKVKAGRYAFPPAETARGLCEQLIAGVPEEEAGVTVAEGKNILDVAKLVAQAGIAPEQEVLALARDEKLAIQLGVPGPTLEGYLFPDTYRFRKPTPAKVVLEAMTKRFLIVYEQIKRAHPEGLASLDSTYQFDDRKIVTMASIVEKETGAASERPRIAGVFLNRLRLPNFKPKLLQTDPTIIYGCTALAEKSTACKSFEGRIRRIHLTDTENPYNTYTHEGLPPGPISNPGRRALEAVFAPMASQELYFVSKNDGTHYFSKSEKEHEAAVDKYQRGKGGGP